MLAAVVPVRDTEASEVEARALASISTAEKSELTETRPEATETTEEDKSTLKDVDFGSPSKTSVLTPLTDVTAANGPLLRDRLTFKASRVAPPASTPETVIVRTMEVSASVTVDE